MVMGQHEQHFPRRRILPPQSKQAPLPLWHTRARILSATAERGFAGLAGLIVKRLSYAR